MKKLLLLLALAALVYWLVKRSRPRGAGRVRLHRGSSGADAETPASPPPAT